jgi:hypothetical protein
MIRRWLYLLNKKFLYKDILSSIKDKYSHYYMYQELGDILVQEERNHSILSENLIAGLDVNNILQYSTLSKQKLFTISCIIGDKAYCERYINDIDLSNFFTKRGINIFEFLISQHIFYLKNNNSMLNFNTWLIKLVSSHITQLNNNITYAGLFLDNLIKNNTEYIFNKQNENPCIIFKLLYEKNLIQKLGYTFVSCLIKDSIKFKNLLVFDFLISKNGIDYISDIDVNILESYDIAVLEYANNQYPHLFKKKRNYLKILCLNFLAYEEKFYYGEKPNEISLNNVKIVLDFLNSNKLLDNHVSNFELFFLLLNSKLSESKKNEVLNVFNIYCTPIHPLIKHLDFNTKINKDVQNILIKTDNIYSFTSEIFGKNSKRFTRFCAEQLKCLTINNQNNLLLARFGRLLTINADFIFYKLKNLNKTHFISKHNFELILNKLIFLMSFYNDNKRKMLYSQFLEMESMIEYPIIDCYNKLQSLSEIHLSTIKDRINKNVKNICDVIDDLNVIAHQCDSYLIKFDQDLISDLNNKDFSDFIIKVPTDNIELYELGQKMANCLRNKNNNYINQIVKKEAFIVYLESKAKIYCITFSYNMKNLKFLEFKGIYNENVPSMIISEFFKYLDNYLMLK